MPSPAARLVPLLLALILCGGLHAEPADDAVSAVLKLRSIPEYTWEVSTSKPGDTTEIRLPRTKHGSINAAGEMVVEQIWPDGLVLETVTRRDGTAVVQTPGGWYTKAELDDLVRKPKRGTRTPVWLRFATAALEGMTPEEEITRLLNEAKSYERSADNIDAVLGERAATYWLGSARLIPNSSGTMRLRLRDGLIRECRISATGEKPLDYEGKKFTRVEFETSITFNYSVTPALVPYDAKQKLDAAAAR